MLIVAIPKSASTSLMDTISKLQGVEAKQSFPKHLSRIKDLPVLSNYHSDIRELDKTFVNEILAKENQINKQHIAPTDNNISFIAEAGLRPVILLRDPCGIVDAYYRAEINGLHKPREEFAGVTEKGIDAWRNKSAEIGLTAELKWWYKEWKQKASESNFLIVEYKDLMNNPAVVINKIEREFNLSPTPKILVRLSKKRYSRKAYIRTLGKLYSRYNKLSFKMIRLILGRRNKYRS